MKKPKDITEKRGFAKLGVVKNSVAIIATLVLLACFGHMVYHVCFRQHLASGDAEFMSKVWEIWGFLSEGSGIRASIKETDYNIWAGIVAYISMKTGVHPLELCHRILPGILMGVMFLEYLYLGFRLFVMERKGRYYTFMGMTVFASAFFFLQYVIRYIDSEPAVSVYINIWRENVIAGLVILPLILATFLRIVYSHTCKVNKLEGEIIEDSNKEIESDEEVEGRKGKKRSETTKKDRKNLPWIRDIAILFAEVLLCVVVYSWQNIFKIFYLDDLGLKYIVTNLWKTDWPFFMALGCIVIAFMLKMKGIIPVVAICLMAAVMGLPIPLAVIIAFGVSALIVNSESIDLWLPVSFVIFGIGIYVLAIETGSAAHFSATFEPVKNKYRIAAGTPELVDYLLDGRSVEDGSKIGVVTDKTMAEAIEAYSPYIDAIVVEDVTTDTAAVAFDAGLDQGDYVIIKSDIEPSDALLINDE